MDDSQLESATLPHLLMRFAMPALGGMLANALYNIVDRIFVGQTLGRDGLAATALAFPCMLFFFSLSMMVGVGASSRVSIMLGQRRKDDAERALGTSVMMSAVMGVLLTAVVSVFCRDVLVLSGASGDMLKLAYPYLSIVLYGAPFHFAGAALSSQIRAAGSPSYAMGSQVLGAIINIALDAWFVLALGMGIRGAAAATAISQFVSFVWTAAFFLSSRQPIRLKARYVFTFDRHIVGRIASVGLPSCFVEINFAFVTATITSTVSRYGGDIAVSATGVYTSLDSLLFLPGMSLGEACQPIIGYNYGAGRYDRVIGTVKLTLEVTTVLYLASTAAIMFAGEHLARLFVHGDPDLIALSAVAMRVSNIGLPLFGCIVVSSSFMQGIGLGRDAMISSAVRYILFLWVPLLSLPRYFGAYGAWGAFSVSDICGASVAMWFIMRTARRLRA